MNIVEFALKFRDMASGPLRSFGASARQSFSNAVSMAGNVTRGNRRMGASYDELGNRIRNTGRDMDDFNRRSARGSNGGGGFNAMSLIKGAGIVAAGYQAAAFFGGAMKAGLERQQIQTSFNVLTGSEQAGGALTKQLVDLQKNTVLGSEVFKNAQTMLGFGFKDTEVLSNMKMLGDVSMGDAEKLGSLTLAFSQIRAAGKMQGQDLLQLINAGFNPLEQISKSTGKSMGDLKKQMEDGNISFAMVQQAFKDATGEGGKFNGMLEKMAQTPAGKMQALSGAWDEFKVSAGTAFMPLISMAVDFGNKMLPILETFIQPMARGVENIVTWIRQAKPYFVEMLAPAVAFIQQLTSDTSGWMDYLLTIKTLFLEHIYPVIKKVVGLVFNVVGQIIEFVKSSELLKDIFNGVYAIIGSVWDILGGLIDGLSWVFNNVVMPILKGIEAVYRWFKGSNSQEVVAIKPLDVAPPKPKKKEEETTNTDLITENTKAIKENTDKAKASEQAITSGGPKVVNITVQKFLDSININSTNLPAAASEMEQTFLELFARVLAQGAQTA